ncbi:hypothetical protein GOODEAATRI_027554, partial [Goodea atripinnis]
LTLLVTKPPVSPCHNQAGPLELLSAGPVMSLPSSPVSSQHLQCCSPTAPRITGSLRGKDLTPTESLRPPPSCPSRPLLESLSKNCFL